MGAIRTKGDVLHVWVPGVKQKTVKGQTKVIASEAIDDAYELSGYAKSGEYALVAVDTFTKMTESVVRNIVNKDLSGQGTKRVTVSTGSGASISLPTQQDYGMLGAVCDEWRADIWPAVMNGTFVLLSGHEKILTDKDENDITLASFGSLATAGQMVMRNLPGSTMLMLRGVFEKADTPKHPPVRVLRCTGDKVWKAKDRLGVFDESGVEVGIARAGMDPEEHKEAIVEAEKELWEDWTARALKRGVTGFIGLYSTPGWGKTLLISSLALVLYEKTGKPSLLADWDCEGNAAVPDALVTIG